MTASLLVASGGALGSWLRYIVARLLPGTSGFAWATLGVNVAGSLAMGLLAGWLARSNGAAEPTRLFLAVGVLGGFTTFSAFSLDAITIIQRGQPGLALTYIATTLVAGLTGLWLGLQIMRTVS